MPEDERLVFNNVLTKIFTARKQQELTNQRASFSSSVNSIKNKNWGISADAQRQKKKVILFSTIH